jgi:hypothetical protein
MCEYVANEIAGIQCLGFLCLAATSCLIYFIAVLFTNRQRDRRPRDLGLTEYEKTELGVCIIFLSFLSLSPSWVYLPPRSFARKRIMLTYRRIQDLSPDYRYLL